MNPPTADDTREPACRGNTSGAPPSTAAAARERVGALLRRAGISLDSVTAADALLVTSELVTNAIRHGGGVTAFHADITDDALHLSVADPSPRTPSVRTHSPAQPGGFGWPLIQHLTEHIDISRRPDGKTITTTLRLA
ncbi:ATP-binding protein [Streptomyces sp. NPDC058662]|uniref:ATP-binding protein n=1 Tax=Streptomyces sp. NPDC058662 TaxID=3346583 RepID=UPI00364702B8